MVKLLMVVFLIVIKILCLRVKCCIRLLLIGLVNWVFVMVVENLRVFNLFVVVSELVRCVL